MAATRFVLASWLLLVASSMPARADDLKTEIKSWIQEYMPDIALSPQADILADRVANRGRPYFDVVKKEYVEIDRYLKDAPGLKMSADLRRTVAGKAALGGAGATEEFKKAFAWGNAPDGADLPSRDRSATLAAFVAQGGPGSFNEYKKTTKSWSLHPSTHLLTTPEAETLSARVAAGGPGSAEVFETVFQHHYRPELGPLLVYRNAVVVAAEVAMGGPPALKEYQAAFCELYAANGLFPTSDPQNRATASHYAGRIAVGGAGALAEFRRAYRFATARSGLQLKSKEAAMEVASRVAMAGPGAAQAFEDSYIRKTDGTLVARVEAAIGDIRHLTPPKISNWGHIYYIDTGEYSMKHAIESEAKEQESGPGFGGLGRTSLP